MKSLYLNILQRNLFKLAAGICVLNMAACTQAPVGSKKRPFAMYFVPSSEAHGILESGKEIAATVSTYVSQKLYGKDEGFYVTASVPTSYIAVVEAFGSRKADFAALTTFAYILAKDMKKYDVEAILSIERYGGERTYKGQIIAHRDSGFKNLEDLAGKKFAFVDSASTSGFILPSQLLKDKNIELAETVFAQKHDNVVQMVYNKQIDAGATFYQSPNIIEVDGKTVVEINDARARVKSFLPDVEDKVLILAFTPEVPTEPWVIRSKLFEDEAKNTNIKNWVIEALLEYSKTPSGLATVKALAMGTSIFRCDDARYDQIRALIKDSQIDISKLIAK